MLLKDFHSDDVQPDVKWLQILCETVEKTGWSVEYVASLGEGELGPMLAYWNVKAVVQAEKGRA